MKFEHITHTFNLGDELCSPKHYFNFRARDELSIIGGGVQTKYILGEKQPSSKAILWGAGCTGSTQKDLKASCNGFLKWGIRDRVLVDNKSNFLPCVSSLHPMLDIPSPEINRSLLYVNADPRIYTLLSLKKTKDAAAKNNALFLTNRAPERKFINYLTQSTHIITNSYHGAFWGLLSGRSVTLMGYSFKFRSLVDIMGIQDQIIRFDKGDQNSLLYATMQALQNSQSQRLENPEQLKNNFRNKNLEFAESLVKDGILEGFSLKVEPGNPNLISDNRTEIISLLRYYTRLNIENSLRDLKSLLQKKMAN